MQFIDGSLTKLRNKKVEAQISLAVPPGVDLIGLVGGALAVQYKINPLLEIKKNTGWFQLRFEVPEAMFDAKTFDLIWDDCGKSGIMPLILTPTHLDTLKNMIPVRDRVALPIAQVAAAVNDNTERISDLSSFPIMNVPLNLGLTNGPAAGIGNGLQQQAAMAVQQVLGWKPRDTDPAAFVGALTQSFELKMFEGHVVSRWTPRTYTVQTDLAGGISGAQASLYERANKSVIEAKLLLEGLRPLRVVADPEDSSALKGLIADQLDELVSELGMITGPRVPRVDTTFLRLLAYKPGHVPSFEPDKLDGMMGDLRKELGLSEISAFNFVNTVEEEQVITNFRIVCDYIGSLTASWDRDRSRFLPSGVATAFFGTRLVHINRVLATIAESVQELRLRYDSVFLGGSERATILITKELYIEELLDWVYRFAAEEAPEQIREGGKYGAENAVLPTTISLLEQCKQARDGNTQPPPAHFTGRVQGGWLELINQLEQLEKVLSGLKHKIPSLNVGV